MLQFPLELQKVADGEFSLQVFSKKVCGESRAAAGRLQGVSCGRAVAVSHAHTGLGTYDALDLRIEGGLMSTRTIRLLTISLYYSINNVMEIVKMMK